ncbi:MAG: two-component system sensor histidine kinase PfeS [Candidatus Endobugula sp.]
MDDLQIKENTWVSVVASEIKALPGNSLDSDFIREHQLGRGVDWKIHLYFDYNPIMDVPFDDGSRHFLIKLPQRMRPGNYLTFMKVILEALFPLVLLSLVCWMVYLHVMKPLNLLKVAANEFGRGKFTMRIKNKLGQRNDELMSLADAFDDMAERTSELIVNQRHLLSDLSHVLRAPLSRLDMAVEYIEQELNSEQALSRLKQESITMRHLIEDTLMLARSLSDLGGRSEAERDRGHFFDHLRRIVSLFYENDREKAPISCCRSRFFLSPTGS